MLIPPSREYSFLHSSWVSPLLVVLLQYIHVSTRIGLSDAAHDTHKYVPIFLHPKQNFGKNKFLRREKIFSDVRERVAI